MRLLATTGTARGRRERQRAEEHDVQVAVHTDGLNEGLSVDDTLAVSDGRALPWPDRSFDVVHASLLVHHLEPQDALAFLREAARAIYPGGKAATRNRQGIVPARAAINHAAGKGWFLKLKLADNDSGTAAVRTVYGIALHASLDGQPLSVIKRGPLTLNAVLTAGTTYVLSSTPGGIAPQADAASGDEVVILGVALSTTSLDVNIKNTGVTL